MPQFLRKRMKQENEKKTESFKGLRKMFGGESRFAKTSIESMRKAGKAAGEAIKRI